jgi:hypothetical protein
MSVNDAATQNPFVERKLQFVGEPRDITHLAETERGLKWQRSNH